MDDYSQPNLRVTSKRNVQLYRNDNMTMIETDSITTNSYCGGRVI